MKWSLHLTVAADPRARAALEELPVDTELAEAFERLDKKLRRRR